VDEELHVTTSTQEVVMPKVTETTTGSVVGSNGSAPLQLKRSLMSKQSRLVSNGPGRHLVGSSGYGSGF
jgi:hypothetical protein